MDKFTGDFVDRHINAISLYTENYIILVVVNTTLKRNEFKIHERIKGNNTYFEIHYPCSFNPLINYINKKKAYKIAIQKLKTIKFDIVHQHITYTATQFARTISNQLSIPLIITEHATHYLKSDARFEKNNFIFKKNITLTFAKAKAVTVVSKMLGECLVEHQLINQFHVIPNVVDTDLFAYKNFQTPTLPIKFIHVSNFSEQKNCIEMLQAFKIIENKYPQVHFTLVGNKNKIENLIEEVELNTQKITIIDEIEYKEVAKMFNKNHVHILCSKFETFACVNAEALCCGLPLIVTPLQCFEEYCNDENSITANGFLEADIEHAIEKYILKHEQFNRTKIAKIAAQQFNYNTVGKQFFELYKQVLCTN